MKKIKVVLILLFVAAICLSSTACNQTPASPHICESVCQVCGKCTDALCIGSACIDKCQGHEVNPGTPHVCESACVVCGKCTDASCTESACINKCQGHPEDSQYTNIDTILGQSGVTCTVKGLVVARNAQSFIVKDNTGHILVYLGSTWNKSVAVGDMVTVSGTTAIYAKGTQFGKESQVQVLSHGNSVTHPTAGSFVDSDYAGTNIYIKYISVKGTVNISGNYVNLSFENNSGLTGSVTYPEDNWSSLNGKTVVVTGYVTGISGNPGKYLSIMATEYREDVSDETVLNIFSINDNHGDFYQNSYGMDKIAAGINSLSGDYNIKIANGDLFQGTYVSSTQYGLPMVDALNAMDFDCFVLGNHEFDWGLEKIALYKDGNQDNGEADFPFLGANIIEKSTGKCPSWIEPYTVISVGEIKVGVIGLIGEYQESSIIATVSSLYDFVNGDQLVIDYAKELRTEQDCDIVIVAVHDYDDNFSTTLQKWANYSGESNVDAIFCAHSHQAIDDDYFGTDGDVVPVLQNGGNGQTFARLQIWLNEENEITDKDGTLFATYNFNSDGTLDSVITKHMSVINAGNEVIASTDTELSRGILGNYIVDAMVEEFSADFAIMNTGGVRNVIAAGDITLADVFQVFPFENSVIICEISGELLKQYADANDDYNYYSDATETIDITQTYTLAIVDYVFYGSYFDDYRPDDYIITEVIVRNIMNEFMVNDF